MNSKKGIDKAEKRAAPIDAPIDVHFWIFEFFGFFGFFAFGTRAPVLWWEARKDALLT